MTHTNVRSLALVGASILCVSTPALAQRREGRVPREGGSAVEGEVGLFMPRQDHDDRSQPWKGPTSTYSARNSLRVGAGWANPKVDREKSDSTRQVRVGADLVHNWEGGAIHPFVGAGVGSYFLQPIDNGNSFGSSQTRVGGRLLGGVEFFTSKTFSVKGEARYDAVTKGNGYDPSGVTLSIGIKSYF